MTTVLDAIHCLMAEYLFYLLRIASNEGDYFCVFSKVSPIFAEFIFFSLDFDNFRHNFRNSRIKCFTFHHIG